MAADFRAYKCRNCGFVYNEAEGLPQEGIAPGTRWEDLPADWMCLDCGTEKDGFDMEEIPLR